MNKPFVYSIWAIEAHACWFPYNSNLYNYVILSSIALFIVHCSIAKLRQDSFQLIYFEFFENQFIMRFHYLLSWRFHYLLLLLRFDRTNIPPQTILHVAHQWLDLSLILNLRIFESNTYVLLRNLTHIHKIICLKCLNSNNNSILSLAGVVLAKKLYHHFRRSFYVKIVRHLRLICHTFVDIALEVLANKS